MPTGYTNIPPHAEMQRDSVSFEFSDKRGERARATAEIATRLAKGADQFVAALRGDLGHNEVVSNLRSSLAGFGQRDRTRYCFTLPHDLVLTQDGFAVVDHTHTGPESGRDGGHKIVRWLDLNPATISAKIGGDCANATLELNNALNELIDEGLEEKKERLGANVPRRDRFSRSCVWMPEDSFLREFFCFPCVVGLKVGENIQNRRWGERFGDGRTR